MSSSASSSNYSKDERMSERALYALGQYLSEAASGGKHLSKPMRCELANQTTPSLFHYINIFVLDNNAPNDFSAQQHVKYQAQHTHTTTPPSPPPTTTTTTTSTASLFAVQQQLQTGQRDDYDYAGALTYILFILLWYGIFVIVLIIIQTKKSNLDEFVHDNDLNARNLLKRIRSEDVRKKALGTCLKLTFLFLSYLYFTTTLFDDDSSLTFVRGLAQSGVQAENVGHLLREVQLVQAASHGLQDDSAHRSQAQAGVQLHESTGRCRESATRAPAALQDARLGLFARQEQAQSGESLPSQRSESLRAEHRMQSPQQQQQRNTAIWCRLARILFTGQQTALAAIARIISSPSTTTTAAAATTTTTATTQSATVDTARCR